MVKRALLVGINYRNTDSELYGCINDVNNLQKFLQSQLGYTNFIILTDDTPVKPTKANILNAINSLVRNLRAGDEVWFQFSGHGNLEYDRSRDEENGKDTCLAPLDYKRMGTSSDDTLRSILVRKIPSKAKLYVILDACHSGTGCDLRYKYDDSSYITNENVKSPTYVQSEWSLRQTSYEFKKYPRTNGEVYCISGCQDHQKSADTFIESEQMYGGVLTSTILSLFRSNDIQKYKWKHLLKDICCCEKNNGYDQVTAITSGKPLDMESPVFSFPLNNDIKPSSIKPSIPSSSNKNKKKYVQFANAILNANSNANTNTVNKLNNNRMKKMIFT